MPIAAVAAGALIDPTTFGNAVADELNRRGVRGYAEALSNQTGIVGLTDLTGLSVTFTAVAGRRYRATAEILMVSTVAGDVVNLAITNGAGGLLTEAFAQVGQAGSFGDRTVTKTYVSNASFSGSTTWKLRAARASGAGTITVVGAALRPNFILVEDLGEL